MARRTKAREILRLLETGMPRSAIARAFSVSKHSVQGNVQFLAHFDSGIASR